MSPAEEEAWGRLVGTYLIAVAWRQTVDFEARKAEEALENWAETVRIWQADENLAFQSISAQYDDGWDIIREAVR